MKKKLLVAVLPSLAVFAAAQAEARPLGQSAALHSRSFVVPLAEVNPPAELDPPATEPPLCERSMAEVDFFGGERFGSNYGAFALALATVNASQKLVFEANGRLGADVSVFGETRSVVDAFSTATIVSGETMTSSSEIYVMGRQIYTRSTQANLAGANGWQVPLPFADTRTWSAKFFVAGFLFMVGPVPVRLTVSVNGKLGLSFNVKAPPNTLDFTAKPFAEVYGVGTTAVEGIVAAAGVSMDLTFLNVSVPVTTSLFANAQQQIEYKLNTSLTLSTLGGRVDLWGRAGWAEPSRLNVFSWQGLSKTIPLTQEGGLCQ